MSWAKSLLSLHDPFPSSVPKGDVPDVLACYGIPYGGLGFLSHVLTYYTIVCLIGGVKPLMPWKPVEKAGTFSRITCGIGALVGAILAIYTVAKCHAYSQFMWMALWKFFFSTFNGLVGVLASPDGEKMNDVMGLSMGFYLFTQVQCLGAVISLVVLTWEGPRAQLAIVTYAFAGIVVVTPIFTGVAACIGLSCMESRKYQRVDKSDTHRDGKIIAKILSGLATVPLLWILPMCGFYSDWALGAIQHDLLGSPSSDNKVLFWTYFIAKRFPMIAHLF